MIFKWYCFPPPPPPPGPMRRPETVNMQLQLYEVLAMNSCSDRQPDSRSDRHWDRQTDWLTDRQTVVLTDRQTVVLTDRQTVVLTDRQTVVLTDRQTDRCIQTDRQTDRQTDMQAYYYNNNYYRCKPGWSSKSELYHNIVMQSCMFVVITNTRERHTVTPQ
jgi:hypothetical protein